MSDCGCNDWMTSHRRTMLRRQGERVPLPRAVLEGATAGLSRRDFLRNGAIGFVTVYGAQALSWSSIWEAAAASAATPSTDPIIVSIFLDGGNDGLNTLVPITGANYAAYLTKRPHIKLDPARLPAAGRPGRQPGLRLEPGGDRLQAAVRRGQDGRDPGGRLPAARPVALPLPRLLAGGRARSRSGHRLAGPVDRPERRRRQPAAGAVGGLVAGRLAEERRQPGGRADQRRRRAVLHGQRLGRPVADGRHARLAVAAHRREPRHGGRRPRRGRRRLDRQHAVRAAGRHPAAVRPRVRHDGPRARSSGGSRCWPG